MSRYIKSEPFTSITGDTFKRFSDPNNLNKFAELSVVESIRDMLLQYEPSDRVMQMKGQSLTLREINYFNKAIDVLEITPVPEFYKLQDEEFDVVVKVLEWVIPTLTLHFMRNGPKLLDYIQAAPVELIDSG